MVIHLIMGNQTYGNARLDKHGTMMNNAMALSENGVQQILIDDCLSSLTQFHYRYIYIYTHLVANVGYTRISHFQTYPPGKPMEKPWKKRSNTVSGWMGIFSSAISQSNHCESLSNWKHGKPMEH